MDAKNIALQDVPDSKRRLEELGHDPLEKLAALHEHLLDEEEKHRLMRDGLYTVIGKDGKEYRARYSPVAHTAVMALIEKVNNDLMRYRYARIPETQQVEFDMPVGMVINMTESDGAFERITSIDEPKNAYPVKRVGERFL